MVMSMKGALGQAEAAYLLGQVYERLADRGDPKRNRGFKAQSVAQFMRCAERFPDSPYAAEGLKKVIKYHYDEKDYRRCVELLERVTRDYQDQDWLHKMYLTWGVVHLRMGQRDVGVEKMRQVIEEYPESDSAVTASKLLEKLGTGPGEESTDSAPAGDGETDDSDAGI